MFADNFNPGWYLLEKHQSVTFPVLKQGLQRLDTELERSKDAPVEFIMSNLETFIQCYDSLSDILLALHAHSHRTRDKNDRWPHRSTGHFSKQMADHSNA